MATSFLNMKSSPTLYVMVPPPLYQDDVYSMNQTVINGVLPIILPREVVAPLVASFGAEKVKQLSIFDALGGTALERYEAFCDLQNCDQCHPNDAGYGALAMAVFKALMNGPPLPSQTEL